MASAARTSSILKNSKSENPALGISGKTTFKGGSIFYGLISEKKFF
jgi:hypothetical protein